MGPVVKAQAMSTLPSAADLHQLGERIDGTSAPVLDRLRNGAVVPPEERSLLRALLVGEDLAGLDLSGWDLGHARLERAKMQGSRLVRARLERASLYRADLSEAELLGANLQHANCEEVRLNRAGLGGANLQGVQAQGAQLEGSTLVDARLVEGNFQAANLRGARMQGADLRGADFSRADLRDADLRGAQVAGASFDGALMEGVRLRGVGGYQRASWLGIDMHRIDFNGSLMLRSFALDQNYLHEFRNTSRMHQWIYQLWFLTSDCGRSPLRWALLTTVLILGFTGAIASVPMDYGDHETWLSPLYMSVVTMTTLGFGDALPASVAGQIVVMVEVMTGYLMLGGLLSLFSNQMARRAE